jgi:glycerophosphoryl diester phosphodiesterase
MQVQRVAAGSTGRPLAVAVPRPRVVAHRGGRGLAPENTLAACSLALVLGVDAIEVDVRLTADGVPILLHDPTLERTTDGRGQVGRLSLTALRAVDATAGRYHGAVPPEPPPRLADALALVAGRAALHVELKGEPRVPARLVASVVRLLAGQVPPPVLLSFDWQALRLARRLAPTLETEALLDEWPAVADRRLAFLAAAGATWLGLRYGLLTAARTRRARKAGLRLNVWTVNRPLSQARAARFAVDAITTDRPDRLLALLASTPTAASPPCIGAGDCVDLR